MGLYYFLTEDFWSQIGIVLIGGVFILGVGILVFMGKE